MKNIVIVDGVRTPFGRLGGGLRQFHPGDLAKFAIEALMERTQLDPKELDAVYLVLPTAMPGAPTLPVMLPLRQICPMIFLRLVWRCSAALPSLQ